MPYTPSSRGYGQLRIFEKTLRDQVIARVFCSPFSSPCSRTRTKPTAPIPLRETRKLPDLPYSASSVHCSAVCGGVEFPVFARESPANCRRPSPSHSSDFCWIYGM
ncbi:hypothetical protein SLEP1_g18715 [Rubroshorea leprosula]|uniref:Uncharacterized protein n=1 Tax=Rubroshorea leprosula TaxID=152421 RepID=A0AAV5J4D4_9ROSI|nr:hypothetical protein SLEP1_g18715 [Rubroshorea leprosula]